MGVVYWVWVWYTGCGCGILGVGVVSGCGCHSRYCAPMQTLMRCSSQLARRRQRKEYEVRMALKSHYMHVKGHSLMHRWLTIVKSSLSIAYAGKGGLQAGDVGGE